VPRPNFAEQRKTMKSINDAVEIPFFIPPMRDGKSHHVISLGKPKFYRPGDLKDLGVGKTAWVDAFEKILTGLYLALEAPVPYAFFTPDGKIRSLDAGCMKMLLNRQPPDIDLNLGADGFISSVSPSDNMLALYEPIRHILRDRIVLATP
jgi:hypothetical protein